ncbi:MULTISPECIES: hypothetical protein [unclassified Beijerinckia]|uniref:hypothetical protein n=1 Tax=unclassified Beijerinckia TaxID=2638183 RepID=UPI000B8959DC|nr:MULTISPECIES: hypothetical protein [unclassified Beijerinckia]
MTLTALSVLAFAASAQAQSQVPQSRSEGSAASDTSAPQRFKKVQIVEFKDLPTNSQNQVDTVIATMQQDDLQKLHQSIDSIPAAAQALKAKGLSSSQVVVASLDDEGTLTLITKST